MFYPFRKTIEALILTVSCLLFANSICHAQGSMGGVMFLESEWDFGMIREADGPVEHTFLFVNKLSKPVSLEIATGDCNCTTTIFSSKPVESGGIGELTVRYNPENLPGQFHKSIRVITDEKGVDPYILHIGGFVQRREGGPEINYPYRIGHTTLRITAKEINFGYVRHGSLAETEIGLLLDESEHTERERFRVTATSAQGIYLTVQTDGMFDKANESKIQVTGSPKKNYYGTTEGSLTISYGNTTREIPYHAIVVDAHTDGPEPSIRLQPSYHEFKKMTIRRNYRFTATIFNDGKTPLIIRKVECEPGTSTDLNAGVSIQPGNSRKITINFRPDESVDYKGGIAIITNDSKRPYREIKCKILNK